MNEIIIYGSYYGTTKKYAEELSSKTGIKACSYKDIKDINAYKTIIYLGGLYAGGVEGMKKTLKDLTDISNKKIIIATVGLADPNDKGNIDQIKSKMRSQISPDIYEKAEIFHLRGGIDYSKLICCWLFCKQLIHTENDLFSIRFPDQCCSQADRHILSIDQQPIVVNKDAVLSDLAQYVIFGQHT